MFASILKFVSNVSQLFAAEDFSRRHFSDAFFLAALGVNFIGKILFWSFLVSASSKIDMVSKCPRILLSF